MPTPSELPPDISPERDPLGILRTTRAVVERAALVRIEPAAVEAAADRLAADQTPPPEWDAALHYRDDTWRTAGWAATRALKAISATADRAPVQPSSRSR